MDYTERLLALPEIIRLAECAVADWKANVAATNESLSTQETNVMLAAVADGKDAEARKMQREAAANNSEGITALRKTHRDNQYSLAFHSAERDRLIREYDALLALVKAG